MTPRVVRVTYDIPLVDFTWSSGAMEVLPGTHWPPRTFWEGKDIRKVRVELERGDAMLRDGNILHRGTPNLNDQPRPMRDQTYKKLRQA